MVTKEQLDQALNAWEVAKDKAMHEQLAWSNLLQHHSVLIDSLRAAGHLWGQAQAEFEKFSAAHDEALRMAWNNMDARCGEYQELLAEFIQDLPVCSSDNGSGNYVCKADGQELHLFQDCPGIGAIRKCPKCGQAYQSASEPPKFDLPPPSGFSMT